ncbi:MAG: 30S ribosomal protein S16 [Phycisphaerales bacterium]|jgi:small subunit ribosomal protein S16
MVRIRMQRLGRRNRPYYRISAAEQRTRRNGPIIEALGFYDPVEKDPAKQLRLNEERIKYWLAKGAQPSETIRDILAKRGLVDVKSWEADRAERRAAVEARVAKEAVEAAKGEKKEEKKK